MSTNLNIFKHAVLHKFKCLGTIRNEKCARANKAKFGNVHLFVVVVFKKTKLQKKSDKI